MSAQEGNHFYAMLLFVPLRNIYPLTCFSKFKRGEGAERALERDV